jgi:serine/threonine-protein kinase
MRADLLRAAAGRPVSATPVMSAAERTELITAPAGGGNGALLPPDDRRSRRGLAWAGIILGILGVFAAAALVTAYLLGDNTPQVTVPDVVNNQEQVAREKLERAGFQVAVKEIPGQRETEGQVTEQNPAGNTKADEGSTVRLTVNAGPDQTQVPDFRNQSLEGARERARLAKLRLTTRAVDSAKEKDTVLTQDPPPGQSVDENSVVRLTVSRGNLATVPNVVGKRLTDAVETLAEAGFTPRISEVEDGSVPVGQVIEQNPAGNQQRPKGSTVTIVVAKAPTPSPPPTDTGSPAPSETPSPRFTL